MPTTQLAYLVSKLVPVQALGSIVLNRAVGGINPRPSSSRRPSSANRSGNVHALRGCGKRRGACATPPRPYVPVAKDGVAAAPDSRRVETDRCDLVLATGHSQPTDNLLLISEGKLGDAVRHDARHQKGMTIPQMQGGRQKPAWSSRATHPAGRPERRPHDHSESAESARSGRRRSAIGADHVVISGDFRGDEFPAVLRRLEDVLAALKGAGVTDAELDTMARKGSAGNGRVNFYGRAVGASATSGRYGITELQREGYGTALASEIGRMSSPSSSSPPV